MGLRGGTSGAQRHQPRRPVHRRDRHLLLEPRHRDLRGRHGLSGLGCGVREGGKRVAAPGSDGRKASSRGLSRRRSNLLLPPKAHSVVISTLGTNFYSDVRACSPRLVARSEPRRPAGVAVRHRPHLIHRGHSRRGDLFSPLCQLLGPGHHRLPGQLRLHDAVHGL